MQAFPLQFPSGWKRTKTTISSRFGKGMYHNPTIAYSRDYVLAELKRMGATQVVLSTNLELRNDGLPYSNQKDPVDKGVAVYFFYDNNQMVIACDTFNNIACNIYAIGKTIQAMRGIERWGCSELLKRAFTGFKALTGAPIVTAAPKRKWWDVLGITKESSKEEIKRAYYNKAKIYHPDNGGTHEEMSELNMAFEESMQN